MPPRGCPLKNSAVSFGQQQCGQPGDDRGSYDRTTTDASSNLGVVVQRLERLLTVDQLAELWQISERTVRRMTAGGRLPAGSACNRRHAPSKNKKQARSRSAPAGLASTRITGGRSRKDEIATRASRCRWETMEEGMSRCHKAALRRDRLALPSRGL